MLPCRLILDPPGAPAWNMAVDEVLLAAARDEGVATLRFYQWDRPTLSLGYFQNYADRQHHAASLGCACVRRHSGGGAIMHDRELTYSLALPTTAPPTAEPEMMYRRVHTSLVETLAAWFPADQPVTNLQLCQVENRPAKGIKTAKPDEPFLCFRRRANCDVLLEAAPSVKSAKALPKTVDGKHKVCGSAQRKKQGAILQHGSVLISESPAAPELPGLIELGLAAGLTAERLIEAWLPRLAGCLELDLRPAELTEQETHAAQQVASEQFETDAWNQKR